MGKRVLVILGHPSNDSFCAGLAKAYIESASAAGHEVRHLRLGELEFDPILREGYKRVQVLEPDLVEAQAAIEWAEHLCVVCPVWWGSVPALLKGFLDRVFLPGFAFSYRAGAIFPDQLLKGRSADIIVTMDTPPWYFKWGYRMPAIHQLRKTTLEFCGIRPVRVRAFGALRDASEAQLLQWLSSARGLAERI